jgi:hypothetical protein
MADEKPRSKLRTVLAPIPDRWSLPSRPSAAPPAVQDSYRQTQFLLDGDLALLEQLMNLQLEIVRQNAKPKTPALTGLLGFWSRSFSHLSDACTLLTLGAYSSCVPVLRAACDCIAAQRSLAGNAGEYEEWLTDAVSQDRGHAGLGVNLGRFRAASAFAEDEDLGAVYRLLTDLSMPHFGATLLHTARDTSLQKLALAFADNSFHLGWAELTLHWLLSLASAQTAVVVEAEAVAVDDRTRAEWETARQDVQSVLGGKRRCYVEEDAGGWVFFNFRRAPSGAPRRLVLR